MTIDYRSYRNIIDELMVDKSDFFVNIQIFTFQPVSKYFVGVQITGFFYAVQKMLQHCLARTFLVEACGKSVFRAESEEFIPQIETKSFLERQYRIYFFIETGTTR